MPQTAVKALLDLPSYGRHEYLFPARPNPRFKGHFKKPHAWDLGKRFRRVAKLAGIKDLRIHDMRHFAASTLTSAGVPDNIISILTGHKSRDLRRYQHLHEELRRKTVGLIEEALTEAGDKRRRGKKKGAKGSRLVHGPQRADRAKRATP